ncbi:unnamed protein product [Boreogadus saida]
MVARSRSVYRKQTVEVMEVLAVRSVAVVWRRSLQMEGRPGAVQPNGCRTKGGGPGGGGGLEVLKGVPPGGAAWRPRCGSSSKGSRLGCVHPARRVLEGPRRGGVLEGPAASWRPGGVLEGRWRGAPHPVKRKTLLQCSMNGEDVRGANRTCVTFRRNEATFAHGGPGGWPWRSWRRRSRCGEVRRRLVIRGPDQRRLQSIEGLSGVLEGVRCSAGGVAGGVINLEGRMRQVVAPHQRPGGGQPGRHNGAQAESLEGQRRLEAENQLEVLERVKGETWSLEGGGSGHPGGDVLEADCGDRHPGAISIHDREDVRRVHIDTCAHFRRNEVTYVGGHGVGPVESLEETVPAVMEGPKAVHRDSEQPAPLTMTEPSILITGSGQRTDLSLISSRLETPCGTGRPDVRQLGVTVQRPNAVLNYTSVSNSP